MRYRPIEPRSPEPKARSIFTKSVTFCTIPSLLVAGSCDIPGQDGTVRRQGWDGCGTEMRQVRDGSQQHLGEPPARTDAAAPTPGPFAIAQGDIRGTTAGHSRSGAESAEGCGRRVGGWHVPIIVHAFAYVKDQVGTPNPPPEFEEPRNRRLPGRWGCTSLGMDSRERGNDGGWWIWALRAFVDARSRPHLECCRSMEGRNR